MIRFFVVKQHHKVGMCIFSIFFHFISDLKGRLGYFLREFKGGWGEIHYYTTSPGSSTGGSQNYDVNLALSSEGRSTRAPSTQKFGLLIMFCHRDSSLPVESIQSTVRPPCLPVPSEKRTPPRNSLLANRSWSQMVSSSPRSDSSASEMSS